jgi:phosphate-selective porin OprO/OprP
MKVTTPFLMAVILLTGASGVLAQYQYTPSATYAPSASYYASDAADTAALDARISQLEADMKKKADKVDTKKGFDAKVTGRVFLESVTFSDPHVQSGTFARPNNIFGFREAQIDVGGSGFEILDYKVEISYKDGNTSFSDVFLGVKKVPGLDYVRIGHHKVETGMGVLISALNTTAMETTTATQTFSPNRRIGISQTYYFADERVRWFNGIFGSEAISGNKHLGGTTAEPRGIIYNSRLTFVPYYARDGARYFHFGGHYMYRDNPGGNNAANFAAPGTKIGGCNRASNWFTATAVGATEYNQGGLEAAWGYGPLALSSEFYAGSFGKGRDMYGGYVEARCFLTGDCRPYNKRNGVQGGVKTKKNFLTAEDFIQTCHGAVKGFGIQSIGAWEVYTQWGFTDSDRVSFAHVNNIGGRSVDTVLGVTWYWNPNTRVMFEYVHSDGTLQAYTTTGAASTSVAYRRATEDIFATSVRFHF